MVLVVSNTLQYSFGRGIAYFSRRRTGPDNRQVVEGVLRHISKRRQRHLLLEITIDTALATLSSGSQQAKPRPHRNGFVVTNDSANGRIVSQQRGNAFCCLFLTGSAFHDPLAVKR